MKTRLFAFILVLGGSLLQAQLVPLPRVEQRWEGGTVITSRLRERSFTISSPDKRTIIKAPPDATDLHWAEGGAWCLRKINGDRDLYFTADGKSWDLFSHFNVGDARVVHCLPLGGDRFFLIAIPSKPFVLGLAMSPLALGRFNKDHGIKIEGLVDLGLGLVQRIPNSKDAKAAPAVSMRGLAKAAFPVIFSDSSFIPLPEGFALLSDQAGIFWIFDDRGALKREVRLFKSVTNERIKEWDKIEHAVLGCQATSQGTILIASRPEDAVLLAREGFPRDETIETFKDPAQRARIERLENDSLRAYPELEWWTLDPAEGRIWPTPAPQNTQSRFMSRDQVAAFQFRFLPNGNLVFTDEDPTSRPATPSPKSPK
ncbi:MAG TPA: hypothetical protein VJ505_12195 [Holophagaceae bacterium]|nr:hypothetical protein [Holophagaceae bacterium]